MKKLTSYSKRVKYTYVKTCLLYTSMRKRIADEEALFFEEQLKKEINEDREAHGKKPLKEKKEDPKDPPSCGGGSEDVYKRQDLLGVKGA